MKRLLLLTALASLAVMPPSHAQDTSPKPVVERESLIKQVDKSTHIFVGVVRNVVLIRHIYTPSDLVPSVPPFEGLLEVEVVESKLPRKWKPTSAFKLYFKDASDSEIEAFRQHIGKQTLFVTNFSSSNREFPRLVKAYLDANDPQRAEVESLAKKRSNPIAGKWMHNGRLMLGYTTEARAVKVGTTRKELDKHFRIQEKIDSKTTKYAHRDCPYLRLEIEFAPTSPTQTKASPNDKVIKVSEMVFEWPDA